MLPPEYKACKIKKMVYFFIKISDNNFRKFINLGGGKGCRHEINHGLKYLHQVEIIYILWIVHWCNLLGLLNLLSVCQHRLTVQTEVKIDIAVPPPHMRIRNETKDNPTLITKYLKAEPFIRFCLFFML